MAAANLPQPSSIYRPDLMWVYNGPKSMGRRGGQSRAQLALAEADIKGDKPDLSGKVKGLEAGDSSTKWGLLAGKITQFIKDPTIKVTFRMRGDSLDVDMPLSVLTSASPVLCKGLDGRFAEAQERAISLICEEFSKEAVLLLIGYLLSQYRTTFGCPELTDMSMGQLEDLLKLGMKYQFSHFVSWILDVCIPKEFNITITQAIIFSHLACKINCAELFDRLINHIRSHENLKSEAWDLIINELELAYKADPQSQLVKLLFKVFFNAAHWVSKKELQALQKAQLDKLAYYYLQGLLQYDCPVQAKDCDFLVLNDNFSAGSHGQLLSFFKDSHGDMSQIERFLGDHPESSAALTAKGILHLKKRETDQAEEALNRAIALQPCNCYARILRCRQNAKAKKFLACEEDFKVILDQHTNPYTQLFHIEYLMMKREFAQAKIEIDQLELSIVGNCPYRPVNRFYIEHDEGKGLGYFLEVCKIIVLIHLKTPLEQILKLKHKVFSDVAKEVAEAFIENNRRDDAGAFLKTEIYCGELSDGAAKAAKDLGIEL